MFLKAVFVCAAAALIGWSAVAQVDDCHLLDCDACLNKTDCQWLNCSSVLSCRNATLAAANDTCSNASCSENTTSTTPASSTTPLQPTASPTNTSSTTAGNSTSISTVGPAPSVNVSTTPSSGTNMSTTASPSPEPHKNTFDAASFIGGVVLVLGLQAVIFFLYKFCKSKDRNYHTL
ncbi:sialomucin core protein 24 isoform X2 [Antennarius striatus]|uniref:sialomucin core protein 24 isoform X2 n=1 Tax=Antennarius striatus TaxID=241820 RepID=UPI0035B0E9F5